jgi:transglutaminase-like putative cysteine protease
LVGIWVVTLGWLVSRQVFRSTGARLAEAALAIPPGAMYYRLAVGETPVGFASTTIDTLADSIRVDDVLLLDVAALGKLNRTTARSTAIVGRNLRLRSLTVAFDGDNGQFDAHGAVSGDSVLRLALVSAGDSDVARVPVAGAPVVPSLLALRLAFGGELRVGNRYAVRLFDPFTLAERDVALRVAAETTLIVSDSADFDSTANVWVPVLWDTVPAFRVDSDSGALDRLWVDEQGQVVRLEQASGVTVERAAFELAYENFRNRDTAATARASATPGRGAIVPTTALAAGVALGSGPGPAQMRWRVSGVDPAQLALETPDQSLRGDTLAVTRADAATLTSRYLLPARDSALHEWLRAEPLIQVNDPRIGAQTRQIVGRERNAAKAANRILDWVRALRRARTDAVPNAARALESRSGDCSELTVLYVALARAAGLPARPVSGLLWRGGRFYYHAWAEVYLGRWVAVDPLLGQMPADAGRVRLVEGALARSVDLTRAVGNLTLESL